jgi:hypothetical protein
MEKLWVQRSEAFRNMLRKNDITDSQCDSIKERATRMLNSAVLANYGETRYRALLIPVASREKLAFLIAGDSSKCSEEERETLPTTSHIFRSGGEVFNDVYASLVENGFRPAEGTLLWDTKSGCTFSIIPPLPRDEQRGQA